MPKLWIVHRIPERRLALARLCGVAESDRALGGPADDDFATAGTPDVVVLGLEGDFERELEFVHRHHRRLATARWILLCRPEDAAEAARLFEALVPEIVEEVPTARTLRALVAGAAARREAESLAERQQREHIAERFSGWLGGVEVPGLLRALDPSLVALPLLARGVPGSGRALACRYVELFRGAGGPTLRLHARDLREVGELARRLREPLGSGELPVRTVWIDEIDQLSVSTQNALAEWIQEGAPPASRVGLDLRWIATAGPVGLRDRLEPGLERAFAPLRIEIPALGSQPDTLPRFVERVAEDWRRTVGGPPRRFATGALEALAAHPWSADRAELEAVVRTTLAASHREPIEADDLRFPSDAPIPQDGAEPEPAELLGARALEPAGALEPEPVPSLQSALLEEAFHEGAPTEAPQAGAGAEVEAERALPSDLDESERLSQATLAGADEPSGDAERTGADESAGDATSDGAGEPEDLAAAIAAVVPEAIEQADERTRAKASDAAPARTPGGTGRATETPGGPGWRTLARSLSHEIRNPLVSIRTFAELLPEHFDDEAFRERFSELVGRDVDHIASVVARLSSVAEREKLEATPVDVSGLIEELLDERRERIGQSRLLVLRELERDAPLALADAESLRAALAGLIDRALASLPERGDLFVATRRIERAADGQPRLRVLLRHHNPELGGDSDPALEELEPAANVLEYVLAEAVVASVGGSLTIDSTDAQETLLLVDLRTPATAAATAGNSTRATHDTQVL